MMERFYQRLNKEKQRRSIGLMLFIGLLCSSHLLVGQEIDGGVYPVGEFSQGETAEDVNVMAPAGAAGLNLAWPLNIDPSEYVTVYHVDHKSGSGIRDYNCGIMTYNGHKGTDISLFSFYDMDEGVPVLASASGEVTARVDGKFDRSTSRGGGGFGNHVKIQLSNGGQAIYAHLRKGSVNVAVGDEVNVGDVLGLVGSSGNSAGPHLHFELKKNGSIVDPFSGSCDAGDSDWSNQSSYPGNAGFHLLDHGTTSMAANTALMMDKPPYQTHYTAGSKMHAWVLVQNILPGDKIRWRVYQNGTFWTQSTKDFAFPIPMSWWFFKKDLPENPTLYGEWKVEIYHNDELVGSNTFQYDGTPNDLATLSEVATNAVPDGKIAGEFRLSDANGTEAFWYDVVEGPKHGELVIDGGRRRKYEYTPDAGFTGNDTIWVQVTDDHGEVGPAVPFVFEVHSSVASEGDVLPNSPILFTAYPNPFTDRVTFEWQSEVSGEGEIVVYNLLGQPVLTESIRLLAQRQQLNWQAKDLPAGIYFVRIKSADTIKNMTLFLVR